MADDRSSSIAARTLKPQLTRLAADYGMVFVLLFLCGCFCVATYSEQHPTGIAAGEEVAGVILDTFGNDVRVLIVSRDNEDERAFAETLSTRLGSAGGPTLASVSGEPRDARRALENLVKSGAGLDAIACTRGTSTWGLFERLGEEFPTLRDAQLTTPKSYRWPTFLKAGNLINIANQIAIIAIIAIGMTMVIITAGIDLCVGSLVGLSTVVAAWFIRENGGLEATPTVMTLSCLAAIAVTSVIGLFNGVVVTLAGIPPFIVTLAMMLVARGLAYMVTDNRSISELPVTYTWLGRSADLLSIPNAVLLMIGLYASAHIVMSHMALGRAIYAVGGNREAARLSGVPVRRVIVFVYVVSAALAGLGGVILSSQLKTGVPSLGIMYELYVIAAVVVGGTSLHGGEGKIFGTLIGAFIIAVIQNGMNLTGIESYEQQIWMGFVILAAVLLDTLKNTIRRRRSSG